jgi:hypothetical protein
MGVDLDIYIGNNKRVQDQGRGRTSEKDANDKKKKKQPKEVKVTREGMHASLAVSVLSRLENRQTPQMPLRACSKLTCLTRV